MSSLIPIQVVYAGLAGTLIALIVATAQNKWQPRVFFLLALRLAIGWHFLFEGLHKIHSHLIGPTDWNRPFTSEPYFAVAEGPFGEYMRAKYLGDPNAVIAEKVRIPKPDQAVGFAALSPKDQAALCPPAIASVFEKAAQEGLAKAEAAVPNARADADKVKAATDVAGLQATAKTAAEDAKTKEATAEKTETEAVKAEAYAIVAADGKDDAKTTEAKAKASAARKVATENRRLALEARSKVIDADKRVDDAKKKIAEAEQQVTAAEEKVLSLQDNGHRLKLTYARWMYGADRMDAKAEFVSTDVPQSAPDRLAHIDLLARQVKALDSREREHLGTGLGLEVKTAAKARADLTAAKTALAADANGLITNLVEYAGGKLPEAGPKPIAEADKQTMYVITGVGALLLLGLFTRLACVVGAGFLLLTYLTHPPFPWYPLPPNTEGNPLFINKNIIEMLAMLTIAAHPTGKWLGLDSIIYWVLFERNAPKPQTQTQSQ